MPRRKQSIFSRLLGDDDKHTPAPVNIDEEDASDASRQESEGTASGEHPQEGSDAAVDEFEPLSDEEQDAFEKKAIKTLNEVLAESSSEQPEQEDEQAPADQDADGSDAEDGGADAGSDPAGGEQNVDEDAAAAIEEAERAREEAEQLRDEARSEAEGLDQVRSSADQLQSELEAEETGRLASELDATGAEHGGERDEEQATGDAEANELRDRIDAALGEEARAALDLAREKQLQAEEALANANSEHERAKMLTEMIERERAQAEEHQRALDEDRERLAEDRRALESERAALEARRREVETMGDKLLVELTEASEARALAAEREQRSDKRAVEIAEQRQQLEAESDRVDAESKRLDEERERLAKRAAELDERAERLQEREETIEDRLEKATAAQERSEEVREQAEKLLDLVRRQRESSERAQELTELDREKIQQSQRTLDQGMRDFETRRQQLADEAVERERELARARDQIEQLQEQIEADSKRAAEANETLTGELERAVEAQERISGEATDMRRLLEQGEHRQKQLAADLAELRSEHERQGLEVARLSKERDEVLGARSEQQAAAADEVRRLAAVASSLGGGPADPYEIARLQQAVSDLMAIADGDSDIVERISGAAREALAALGVEVPPPAEPNDVEPSAHAEADTLQAPISGGEELDDSGAEDELAGADVGDYDDADAPRQGTADGLPADDDPLAALAAPVSPEPDMLTDEYPLSPSAARRQQPELAPEGDAQAAEIAAQTKQQEESEQGAFEFPGGPDQATPQDVFGPVEDETPSEAADAGQAPGDTADQPSVSELDASEQAATPAPQPEDAEGDAPAADVPGPELPSFDEDFPSFEDPSA